MKQIGQANDTLLAVRVNALSIVKAYGADVNTGVKENREFCFRKMNQFAERAKFFAKFEHSAAQNDIIKVVLAF